MNKIKLREIAYARSGEKGDIANICVVPYNGKDYELLKRELTVEKVKEAFAPAVKGKILRYEYPGIKMLNFVMYQALWGGVSRSLCLDVHGKNRPSVMLRLDIDVPDDYVPPAKEGEHVVWTR